MLNKKKNSEDGKIHRCENCGSMTVYWGTLCTTCKMFRARIHKRFLRELEEVIRKAVRAELILRDKAILEGMSHQKKRKEVSA